MTESYFKVITPVRNWFGFNYEATVVLFDKAIAEIERCGGENIYVGVGGGAVPRAGNVYHEYNPDEKAAIVGFSIEKRCYIYIRAELTQESPKPWIG